MICIIASATAVNTLGLHATHHSMSMPIGTMAGTGSHFVIVQIVVGFVSYSTIRVLFIYAFAAVEILVNQSTKTPKLSIRTGFDANPDPAFEFNAGDPGF
jgi:hypothetical protein